MTAATGMATLCRHLSVLSIVIHFSSLFAVAWFGHYFCVLSSFLKLYHPSVEYLIIVKSRTFTVQFSAQKSIHFDSGEIDVSWVSQLFVGTVHSIDLLRQLAALP